MKTLSPDWMTEGLIDLEYKTYVLLAYLSDIQKEFDQKKIYPSYSDLYKNYKNLIEVKEGREKIKQAFPKQLSSADFQNLKLEYSIKAAENDFFEVMDKLLEYSIPAMEGQLKYGMEMYRLVDSNLHISELGIQALDNHQGYFFLMAPPKKETSVYQYNLTKVHLPDGQYRAIHVSHLDRVSLSFSHTLESLKTELVKKSESKTFPATFLIESDVFVPWEESLLPVAKRRLIEFLSKENKF
jgi:uncharacterized protein YktA (UPF0223 family)